MDQDTYDQYKMQSDMQERQANSQKSIYAPQMVEQVQQAQAILVEQTNPKKIVKDILCRLKGIEINSLDEESKVAEPKMNELGIQKIWFILDSHINQNVTLSNLDKQEIRNIMDGLSEDLVDDLSLNWKIYGIKSKTDLDVINDSVLYNTFMALKRAEGGNEKKWLGQISIEQINQGGSKLPNVKKEGFFSKLRI